MVGPADVATRIEAEFPGVTVKLSDVKGLDATFEFDGGEMKVLRAARTRARELCGKARFFNAHMAVGHAGNKRNWWKRA